MLSEGNILLLSKSSLLVMSHEISLNCLLLQEIRDFAGQQEAVLPVERLPGGHRPVAAALSPVSEAWAQLRQSGGESVIRHRTRDHFLK